MRDPTTLVRIVRKRSAWRHTLKFGRFPNRPVRCSAGPKGDALGNGFGGGGGGGTRPWFGGAAPECNCLGPRQAPEAREHWIRGQHTLRGLQRLGELIQHVRDAVGRLWRSEGKAVVRVLRTQHRRVLGGGGVLGTPVRREHRSISATHSHSSHRRRTRRVLVHRQYAIIDTLTQEKQQTFDPRPSTCNGVWHCL